MHPLIQQKLKEFEEKYPTTENKYDGGKMIWTSKEDMKSFLTTALEEAISTTKQEILEWVKNYKSHCGKKDCDIGHCLTYHLRKDFVADLKDSILKK